MEENLDSPPTRRAAEYITRHQGRWFYTSFMSLVLGKEATWSHRLCWQHERLKERLESWHESVIRPKTTLLQIRAEHLSSIHMLLSTDKWLRQEAA